MNRKTTLGIATPVLFFFFLLIAGIEKGTHFFDFRILQFQSSLFFVAILFLALGAFSMFVLILMFPPRLSAAPAPPVPRALAPARRQSPLQQASAEAEMGHTQAAIAILHQVSPADPEFSLSRKMLGDLATAESNDEQAEFCYQEALKTSVGAERGPVLIALANLYETLDKLDAASELYRETLRLFPQATEPVFRLRSLAMERAEWEEALYWQSHLEEHFPELAVEEEEESIRVGVRFEFAASEFQKGSAKNAQALIKNIFRITDSFTPAYLLAGEILEKLDNGSAAIRMWEKGFGATGSPVLMQRVSEALLGENLPEKAVEHFQRTVRENPGVADLEYCLGDLYLRLEMVREAQHIFEQLREQYPEWRLNSRTLADIYCKSGEFKKAAEIYSGIIDHQQRVLPWVCYKCNTTYERYRSRCSVCRDWNTVQVNSSEAGNMELNVKNTARAF